MELMIAVALALAAGPPATGAGAKRPPKIERGLVSYYHDSLAGNRTASGERYDPRAKTCAHRKLPFGTCVEVTVKALDAAAKPKVAYCRVNDRGPFVKKRILDVSRAVAVELDLVARGVAKAQVRVLEPAAKASTSSRTKPRASNRECSPRAARRAR